MVNRADVAREFENQEQPQIDSSLHSPETSSGDRPDEKLNGSDTFVFADQSRTLLPSQSHTNGALVGSRKPLGIRTKTTLYAIALGTLPLLITSGLIYNNANHSLRQQTTTAHEQTAREMANRLSQFMAERYSDVQLIAGLPVLSNAQVRAVTPAADQQAILKQALTTYRVYDNIAVFSVNGNPVLQTGQATLPSLKDDPTFRQTLDTAQPQVTQPQPGSDGKTRIYLMAPVKDSASQAVTGVVRVSLPVSVLETVLQSTSSGTANSGSTQYQVANPEGEFFIAAEEERLGQNVATDFPTLEWSNNRQTSQTVIGPDAIDQQKRLISYTPVPEQEGLSGLQWGLVLSTDAATALAAERSLLLQFLVGGGLAALLAGAIAAWLGNRATRSLLKTARVLQEITDGNLNTRLAVEGGDEIATVGTIINQMTEQMQSLQVEKEANAKRNRLVADLTSSIRQTLDFDTILRTSVEGVRQVLDVDRTVIYRFNPDFKSGEITAESVREGYTRAIGQTIHDPLMPDSVARYKTGRVTMVENLSTATLSSCHCEILERLEVKANIVAPILVGSELIGLLCAHQCSGPRYWDDSEIELVKQLSTQIGFALSQAALLKQQSDAAVRERQRAAIVSRMREFLDEESVLQVAVRETRTALASDRVLVYMFDETWSGQIIAESVDPLFPKALGATITDPCFANGYIEKYKQGRIQATNNILEAGLTECHLSQLKPFEVKANLVAPILVNDQLKGLFVAHQCAGPREWTDLDTNFFGQIAIQLGFALEQARLFTEKEQARAQAEAASKIVARMRESLDEESILQVAVKETRQSLQSDRVLVYMFDETWSGTIIAESVDSQFPKALGASITDPCFADGYIEKYKQGRIQATNNILAAGLTDCHLAQLKPFSVKANLVAPILVNDQLKGLFVAHQCSGPRQWTELDTNFFRQIATQLGFALEQAKLFTEKEQARLLAESASQEENRLRSALQMELVSLLDEVEGAAQGDLTVRADITAGEIGTVADFFNSIIENLRQIVTQVKQSATQVNESLSENEGAMRNLAEEALRQAEETTRTLDSVEAMTKSIQAVATSAQQAAMVAHKASATAEAGKDAIARTVQNILNLRETVGETAKKVKRLGESSQQISKVVSLINQIAMQTNLLAINAGIEAARAGEEGQGFAVVAEEVGELAARSAAATQEIEKIVENIQRETAQVVDAMEQSTAQVVEGTHLVEDAKSSLHQILEVSRQIDELVQSISHETVSQVTISETVSTLMKQIAEVSAQTSGASRQVSASMRQTVAIAQQLQESVGAFKITKE
jgi:methyl-accepting chemotaxis protein PixJ